jgi:hypothetical protein
LQKVANINTKYADDPDGLQIKLSDLGPAKPWLLLVPNNLVTQWCKEATKLSSFFRLVVYHTDRKNSNQIDVAVNEGESVQVNAERCTKIISQGSRQLVNIVGEKDSELSKVTLVITTPQSFIRRHGPRALSVRRLTRYHQALLSNKISQSSYQQKCRDASEGGRLWGVCDRVWPANLSGVFGGLVIDEAHAFRNPTSQSTIAATWVKADKRFLMTATPIWNGQRDVMGYIELLQTQANMRAQAPYAQDEITEGVTGIRTKSPYDPEYVSAHTDGGGNIDKDTRRRALASAAYRKYIVKDKCTQPHLALERVFDEILVRHNYSSSLPPGHPEYSIARNLPQGLRYTRECAMSPEWLAVFKHYGDVQYQRLRMPIKTKGGQQTGKNQPLGVNGNSHRGLTAASTFPALMLVGVPKSDSRIKYKLKTLKKNREEHIERIIEAARQKQIREKHKQAKRDVANRWRGWPETDPEIDKEKLPSKFHIPTSPALGRCTGDSLALPYAIS